jgi:hypothetical protein
VVTAYKGLSVVERDFRSMKAIDLDLRPIYHFTEDRVRSHVFVCMLAAYLVWHLRKAWAPLCFTDEELPRREDPGLPWVWWRLPRFDVSGTGWSLLGPSMHDLGVVVKPVDAVIAGSQSGSGRSCQTAPVLSLWRSQR